VAVEEALRQAREKAGSGGEFGSPWRQDCPLCQGFDDKCKGCPLGPIDCGKSGSFYQSYQKAAGPRKTAKLYEGIALIEEWLVADAEAHPEKPECVMTSEMSCDAFYNDGQLRLVNEVDNHGFNRVMVYLKGEHKGYFHFADSIYCWYGVAGKPDATISY